MVRIIRHRPSPAMVVALIALLVALGGVAFGSIPGPGGVVKGCYSKSTGSLRVIDSKKHCSTKHERTLSWNQQGVRGVQGIQGIQGSRGLQGLAGLNGQNGTPGAPGPTFAAVGSAVADPGSPPSNPSFTDYPGTTFTTPTAGNLLAFGTDYPDQQASCPAGSLNCRASLGLYLDGNPVPHSVFSVLIDQNTTRTFDLPTLTGLASSVSAGSHRLTIGFKAASSNQATLVGGFAGTSEAVVLVG
jgi:hypothetical protein